MPLRLAVALGAGLVLASAAPALAYRNPVPVKRPSGERLETFADPSVLRPADGSYYAFATSDPLDDRDREANGALRIRRFPFARSTDLVNWTDAGERSPRHRHGRPRAAGSGHRTSASTTGAISSTSR